MKVQNLNALSNDKTNILNMVQFVGYVDKHVYDCYRIVKLF